MDIDEPEGSEHATGDPHSAEATRDKRNATLPDPEVDPKATPDSDAMDVDTEQDGVPPDDSQGSLRGTNNVHRMELAPVHAQMRAWAQSDSQPLARLLENAAQRRADYETAMKPVRDAKRAVDDARKEHDDAKRALKKARKEAKQASGEDKAAAEQAVAQAKQAVADTKNAIPQAEAAHKVAREAHKGTEIPATAFTERELRETLGDEFARMNDGERHVVVATLARMSLAFHADHAVGLSPEPAADGDSPYANAPNKKSGAEDPAKQHDESVATGRRERTSENASASTGFPTDYREDGSPTDHAIRDLQQKTMERDGTSTPPSIGALLHDAERNVADFTDKNYAVLEVVNANGESTYVIDSSLPTGSDGVVPRHSEKHLLDWFKRLNESNAAAGKPGYTIAGLYTEREPCGLRTRNSGHADCSKVIRDSTDMSGVPVYYSTTYRFDEGRKPLQDAVREEMKAEGKSAAEIKTAVSETYTDAQLAMKHEMHDHLQVVGELWALTRIQMVQRQIDGTVGTP
ncbi:hypothetical protein [Streptomyces sp. NRRL S-1448]|uniref:hypothetical protein n=1 Tax=Streptomyces sp. NRRL S-1448 TaxID=1463883 RepID=UPI00055DC0AA|nr:hypothetical protein [Streptomyces sp. NRRL S-1448]